MGLHSRLGLGLYLLAVMACTALPATTTKPSPPPSVLLDQSGRENLETPVFQPAGPFSVHWSADEIGKDGYACVFTMRLYRSISTHQPHPDPRFSAYRVVDTVIHGHNADTDYQSRSGRYYLEVQASGCNWRVVVKGPPTSS